MSNSKPSGGNLERHTGQPLSGVIAAIATPITRSGDPDARRFIALAEYLLSHGCDGLNVLGTTGEATSFTREQRMASCRQLQTRGCPCTG